MLQKIIECTHPFHTFFIQILWFIDFIRRSWSMLMEVLWNLPTRMIYNQMEVLKRRVRWDGISQRPLWFITFHLSSNDSQVFKDSRNYFKRKSLLLSVNKLARNSWPVVDPIFVCQQNDQTCDIYFIIVTSHQLCHIIFQIVNNWNIRIWSINGAMFSCSLVRMGEFFYSFLI